MPGPTASGIDSCIKGVDLNAHLNDEVPYYHNENRIRCKGGHYKWVLDRGRKSEMLQRMEINAVAGYLPISQITTDLIG